MSDIFLSYAREDLPRIKRVVDPLEKRGWSVWWDRTIRPGQVFDRVIEAALDQARCVIVMWSQDSVQSDWVRDEAREGKRRGILIPALLDDVVMPLAFRGLHAAHLVGWSGELRHAGFDELASAVELLLVAPAAGRADAASVGEAPRISTASPKASPPPETQVNPKDGLTYVWIPPGKFTMGCSPGDSECDDNEKPPHEVIITRGFWKGQTPVTEAAYVRFAKANGRIPPISTDLPLVNVSWDDAQSYCQWAGMRLPTEAEWEYAARAGTTGARYGDLHEVAWYGGNSEGKAHPVCAKQPNKWALYDMLGNVWEWVADWYGDYAKEATADATLPSSGRRRVLRGGSWSSDPKYIRASGRWAGGPAGLNDIIGFRCAGELR